MTLTAYNNVPVPSFMYGTAWKKEATTQLVQSAVEAGFTAIDTANQLIHYQEALVGEALLALATARDHARSPLSSNQVYADEWPGPSHSLRCLGDSHHPSDSVLRQLIGPLAHRLSRLLCLARALSAAGIGRRGLGGVGRH